MLMKLLKADLYKKRMISLILALFVMISSFLIAISSNMIVDLMNSLDYLFTKSSAPHYVQMSEGTLDTQAIDLWASHNSYVKDHQIVEMLPIDGAHVYMGNKDVPEEDSVMNLDFVTQNKSFDFLLNLRGKVIQLASGEIAVPVYFMQHNHLKIGDKIRIKDKALDKEFTIVDFLRDVQMNPSIIHSKRFLVSPNDFDSLKRYVSNRVYLIEFQLHHLSSLREFGNEYQLSELPKNGPSVDYNLYKILNSVTDGITIGMMIGVSILLTLVALFCLRFAILSTMEEDYKQIGIMKAIGIDAQYIRTLYLIKYTLIAGVACGLGYLIFLVLKKSFITNIMLYLGIAPKSIGQELIPFAAVCFIWLIIIAACKWVLRSFNKITAVAALREGIKNSSKRNKKLIPLSRRVGMNINLFIGLREVLQNFRMYILLFFVFIVCTFIVILPINFFNTINAPDFITYMGIGRTDLRIDLRQTNDTLNDFNKIKTYLKNDKDVRNYVPLVTSRFKMINNDGGVGNISIDSGNSAVFPIKYIQGHAPEQSDEIALSYLNSQDLQKHIGDTVNVFVQEQQKSLKVIGIYQDITHGGKTAKALVPFDPETALWYVINVDFKPAVSVKNKKNEYARLVHTARVTYVEDYLHQTLGDLIQQVRSIALTSIAAAILISILIISMFLKLLVTKNYSQIAIMKAIGFSLKDIRIQYLVKALFVLGLSILMGTLLANTLGQKIVGLIWSLMGAPQIQFIINPVQVYLLCPLILMGFVISASFMSILLIKKINIIKMVIE